MKMRKTTLSLIVCLAAIFVFTGPVWGYHGLIKIESAQVDYENEIIHIKGQNFGHYAWVFMDGVYLKIISATDTQIQAHLPALDSGT